MTGATLPPFDRLRSLPITRPVVVAHRGDSRHFAENTLPAFVAAKARGAAMIEFDVRPTRDGELVCLHDESLDRTTDAATVLGPGALVAQLTMAELERLDAGAWHSAPSRASRVPTLADALAVMLPEVIPMIEHKAGAAQVFVDELRRLGLAAQCILQSFDWRFVAVVRQLAPEVSVAVLGPGAEVPILDAAAIDRARALGAGMVHWDHRALTPEAVRRAHDAGLLVCSYTTDDHAGWLGGAVLGIDAACTNDPEAMLRLNAPARRTHSLPIRSNDERGQ